MAPHYWDIASPVEHDGTSDAFELLQPRRIGQTSTLMPEKDTVDGWTIIPTPRLPPKLLSLQSTTHTVRILFWTGLLVVSIITGLSILAASLHLFLPNLQVSLSTSSLEIKNSVSCDLSYEKGSRIQNALTINIRGAAHLTFTQARAIDVLWQLFIGAGGRFAMAWISYNVFMDGLNRIIEQLPISYHLYASLTFSTSSLSAVWDSSKAVYTHKGWRLKSFLVWFALSTLYVLAFPTLMSATAGYVTPSKAGFKMPNGPFLQPDSPDLRSCHKVHHGALIGYTNETIARGPPISKFDIFKNTDNGCGYGDCWEKLRDYPLFASLLNLTNRFPSFEYDANDTAPWATDGGVQLTPYPISYNGVPQNFTSRVTIEGRVYQFRNYQFVPPEAYEWCYCHDNDTISALEDVAQCLPEPYYVWGLSSLLVYINLSLFMIWLLGMYIVWADARIHSALCRSGRRVGGHFRATADLSEAMDEVLGNETCAYSDSELARELSKQPGIRYYASDGMGGVSHIGLSPSSRSRVPYNSTKLYGKAEKNR